MTPEFTRYVVDNVTSRTPYRVAWGIGEVNESYFATWEEALSFARAVRADLLKRRNPYDSVSIYNDATRDLEPVGSNPTGLTNEEREEWNE